MARPLVLVPSYRLEHGRVSRWDDGAAAVPWRYLEALDRAGATPLLAPPVPTMVETSTLDRVDGLLLIGGGDIAPSRFGSKDHPKQYDVDDARDEVEVMLLRAALDRGMPVLAICRGAQLATVAFGGTLLQHLPETAGMGQHGTPNAEGATLHDVKVDPDSTLAAVTGSDRLSCSSHHHQGIDAVGDGLAAVAWAEDGLVEAVEGSDGWLLAVQWHPEDTAAGDPAQQGLFDALSDRATTYAVRR